MLCRNNFLAVGGLALLSFSVLGARAEAQCQTSTGPDVIVGDLSGPTNYNSAAGIEALSIGTTSCNIGNTWLNWIDSTNQHPVIGGNLYRYSVVSGAGRFEQVGMSWLKHGFFALSDTLCCANCSSTDGTHLGVGCSDTYTSSRNGSQSGLGPKYQVNAHTGAFSYPPANPAWSGSVARRVEVDIADLVATGGTTRYFGEGHYVTPDDAAAGNQNNNASWKEVTVSGSGSAWTFGMTGTTHRQESAIRAWPVAESGVTLVSTQIAGDGLFITGYKTTNLGSGIYHYEYAVYNMNADRNGGSFSVPVGAGVNVTNIGFHDVTYRDGDGVGNVSVSGTDWVGAVSGGAITWASQTQAQNANANAIRWGTTYNFRFDANAAPQAGSATLGLWKTGSPASVNIAVDVPGVGGPASFAYCFGDGSGTACPCGNNSTVGNGEGCLNSLGSGAVISVSGTPSLSADSLVLFGSGMPDSSALYFQGTAQDNAGAGTAFGDGLRCAGGSIVRLGTKVNALGTSQYPIGGDQAISIKGVIGAPGVRTYQIWYRNAAAFCTASTFNVSNGYQIVWTL
jgi:hypothetical protein